MPKTVTEIRVLVSSPNGLEAERSAVLSAISQYNRRNSDGDIIVRGVEWQIDVAHGVAEYPQQVVNQEIVDSSDIIVVVLHDRLGTPTATESSGTVEEAKRFLSAIRSGENRKIFCIF